MQDKELAELAYKLASFVLEKRGNSWEARETAIQITRHLKAISYFKAEKGGE